jgi:hypothetical protein
MHPPSLRVVPRALCAVAWMALQGPSFGANAQAEPPADAASATPGWTLPPAPATRPVPPPPPARHNLPVPSGQTRLTVMVPTLLVDARGSVLCQTQLVAQLQIAQAPAGVPREAALQTRAVLLPLAPGDGADANACARLRLRSLNDTQAPESQLR